MMVFPLATVEAQVNSAADPVQALQRQIREAQENEVDLYAPANFAQALKLYGEAAGLRRSRTGGGALRQRVEAAERALASSRTAQAAVRQQLAAVIAVRQTVLQLDPSLAANSRRAEDAFRQAIAKAEAGDAAAAVKLGETAHLQYTEVGVDLIRTRQLPEIQRDLEAAREQISGQDYQAALAKFAAAERLLNARADLASIVDQFSGVLQIYPPEFRKPPSTLAIGDFTLFVEAYETKRWDFQNRLIVQASGTGWIAFQCAPNFRPWNTGILTVQKSFRVVETVKDPLSEISQQNALAIDPAQGVNSALKLNLPVYATSASQVVSSIQDLVQFGPGRRGNIKVHFDGLTIRPGPRRDEGVVLAGSATYPTTPATPDPITLRVAGFTVFLSNLTVRPTGNRAMGALEFPISIVDPGSGHPGRVPLGTFSITSACAFHEELPGTAFGPWSIGNTGVLVQGTGVVADFDQAWAKPGLDPTSPAAQASWKGAILNNGKTVPATDPVISNSGYLRASYSFSNALVTELGLRDVFQLTAPYTFTSLQPVGYEVNISNGSLTLVDSAVDHAQFFAGLISAPKEAVRTDFNTVLNAKYQVINVDSNLDLLSDATVSEAMRWGEYTKAPAQPFFYQASGFTRGRFYLSGTYKSSYFPVDSAGNFNDAQPLAADLRTLGMQGLTVNLPEKFIVFTTDTPAAKPIPFHALINVEPRNWLNISFGGVHGVMDNLISDSGAATDLGPTQAPFYVGKLPFQAAPEPTAEGKSVSSYRLSMEFVSSAVYDCNMSGKFRIPAPVNSDLEFTDLAFTSTSQISGARAPFTTPFKLSYWGLDMVKKPGASAAAVISIRTGQVFFTAAGIREQRHFAVPFYLIWGEMLANGALQRLVFDYSGVGQKFDRFPYTSSFVSLSPYDAANSTKEAFLKVAGTAHFDVFGPKYINVEDVFDPAKPGGPFNNRRIDALKTDANPAGLFQGSDQTLKAAWSGDFGSLDFRYDYDAASQDGFLGSGKMGFLFIGGDLSASIVLKAERACMSVNETTHRDMKLGPVAHFGSMTRTTGCGCIEGGQLQRFLLSAELENTGDVNILLRSASYGRVEWSITPSISTLEVDGDMFLTVLLGGNVEVTGKARFTVNRDQNFVEGELDGSIDAGTALGLSSLKADGQLNWHIGTLGGDSYHSLQGRLAVSVVSPAGGSAGEGGFYIGLNAPKAEAWVLNSGGDRFKLNTTPLPNRLTGVYGFVKASSSINLYVFSGGIEVFAGVGGFVLTPAQVVNLGAQSSGLGPGLPFVIGNVGMHIWGEILGGLVSADGTVDLNVIAPYPFSFQGTLNLEGCVVWVACGSVEVTLGLNSSQGLFVQ